MDTNTIQKMIFSIAKGMMLILLHFIPTSRKDYRKKWELEFVSCSWNACLKRLKSGELDIMLDIAYSEKRAKKFNFSQENVFLNWASIYTRKDFATTSFLDLNERTIATVKEDIHTVGEDGIEHLISKFELDKEIHWYCQDD